MNFRYNCLNIRHSTCSLSSFSHPHQRLSSSLLSVLFFPVGGSVMHFVSHLSLFPAPVSLSRNAWRPLPLVFSHIFHTGWHLGGGGEESKGEESNVQRLWEEDATISWRCSGSLCSSYDNSNATSRKTSTDITRTTEWEVRRHWGEASVNVQ